MPDRQQWVFRNRCGCAMGVMEFGGETVSKAWREFWGTQGAMNRAMDRGVTAVLVPHETYVAEFYPQMSGEHRCPHGGGS